MLPGQTLAAWEQRGIEIEPFLSRTMWEREGLEVQHASMHCKLLATEGGERHRIVEAPTRRGAKMCPHCWESNVPSIEHHVLIHEALHYLENLENLERCNTPEALGAKLGYLCGALQYQQYAPAGFEHLATALRERALQILAREQGSLAEETIISKVETFYGLVGHRLDIQDGQQAVLVAFGEQSAAAGKMLGRQVLGMHLSAHTGKHIVAIGTRRLLWKLRKDLEIAGVSLWDRNGGIQIAPLQPGDEGEILETALSLHDPDSEKLSSLENCLTAARSV